MDRWVKRLLIVLALLCPAAAFAQCPTSGPLTIQQNLAEIACNGPVAQAAARTAIGAGSGGSLSTVSVVPANGFSGTVANPTTTPAITLTTPITGLLKGNGVAIIPSTPGVDYLAPNSNGSALTGLLWSQLASTPTTLSGYGITDALGTALSPGSLLIGNGSGTATPNAPSGDLSMSAAGVFTVTSTQGAAFVASATTDTTNAANISAGILPPARISGVYSGIGGVGTIASGVWNGTPIGNAFLANSSLTIAGHSVALGGSQAVACGDLSNGATGCSTPTGTTSGTIPVLGSGGTLAPATLPTPGASSLGGVQSLAPVAHNFATGLATNGALSTAQPAFTDISGVASPAQLPTPTPSAIGGVQSLSVTTHFFLTGIATSGAVSSAQPAFADISGLGTMAQQSAGAVNITGATLITGLPAPTNASDAATKSYVDDSASGAIPHPSVVAATTAALSNAPAYNNGTSGVGATLTATSAAVLTIDGVSPTLNQRVLVQTQAAPADNGCYTLTTVGTGSVDYQLTRCVDFNTAAAGNLATGASFFVTGGSTNVSSSFALTSLSPITVGTTALTFAQTSGSQSYSADGATLTLTGSQFSVKANGIGNAQLASGVAVANLGFTPVSNALPSANIVVGNGSGIAAGVAMSGDCTLVNTGAVTCLDTNGTPFGTAATVATGTSGGTVALNNSGFTQSGTANFTGALQIGGTAQTFPTSGALVGLSDTQTLTNKTINGGVLNGTLGATTPSSVAATTISASATISGAGFSAYLASPPAIGGTAPGAGNFSALSLNGVTLQGATNTQVPYSTGSALAGDSTFTFNATSKLLTAQTLASTSGAVDLIGGASIQSQAHAIDLLGVGGEIATFSDNSVTVGNALTFKASTSTTQAQISSTGVDGIQLNGPISPFHNLVYSGTLSPGFQNTGFLQTYTASGVSNDQSQFVPNGSLTTLSLTTSADLIAFATQDTLAAGFYGNTSALGQLMQQTGAAGGNAVAAWANGQTISVVGTLRQNADNIYYATTTGTTGSTAPTWTNGTNTDGGVSWAFQGPVGALIPWAAGEVIETVGALRSNGIYEYSATTTGTTASGSGPTCTSGPCSDGAVTWQNQSNVFNSYYIVGTFSEAIPTVNVGGTNTAQVGNVFAANDAAHMMSTATNYAALIGREIDSFNDVPTANFTATISNTGSSASMVTSGTVNGSIVAGETVYFPGVPGGVTVVSGTAPNWVLSSGCYSVCSYTGVVRTDAGSPVREATLQNVRQTQETNGPTGHGLQVDWNIVLNGTAYNTMQCATCVMPNGVFIAVNDPLTTTIQHMAGAFDCLMCAIDGSNTTYGMAVTGGGSYGWRFNSQQLIDKLGLQLGPASILWGANGPTIDVTYQFLSSVGTLAGGTNWPNGPSFAVSQYGEVGVVTASGGVPSAVSLTAVPCASSQCPRTYLSAALVSTIGSNPVWWYPMGVETSILNAAGGGQVPTPFTAVHSYTAASSPVVTLGGTAGVNIAAGLTLSNLGTGTAAKYLCVTSGNVVVAQASAC
jgi:hypothetical protein